MGIRRWPSLFTLVLFASLASSTGHAGGFAASRFGGEHGHPATDHPTALYFNPAGLAVRGGSRVYAEGLFVYRSATYDRPAEAIDTVRPDAAVAPGTPQSGIEANAGRAELSNYLAAPFVSVVSDLGIANFAVGAGVYAPFGGSGVWDTNDTFAGSEIYPGAVDGVQRWANIEGTQRVVYGTVGLAYRLPGPRLSFGVGFNAVKSEVETLRARTIAGTDDVVARGTVVEGRSLLDVSGLTGSVGAGVLWQPTAPLYVGFSYQSQPGFGETGLTGTLDNKFGATPAAQTEVELRQSIPDVFRLGARYLASSQLELRLSGDYTRWSVFDRQCLLNLDEADRRCALTDTGAVDVEAGGAGVVVNLPRNYKDTFGVRAGGSYWFRPGLELAAGAGFDSNAVPDETIDAALFDMNKLIGTLGIRYAVLPETLILAGNVTYVAYFDRSVEPRPRDAEGRAIASEPPSRTPDGAGDYSQRLGLLTIGLEYLFGR
jgi:long-chain fatty acid transport protein